MLQTYHTKLIHKEKKSGNVYIFRFLCEDPDAITFEAGQYVMLLVPQPDGTVKRKHYSISSPATEKNSFELMVKILPQGVASDYLSVLELGQPSVFQGPAGIFTLKDAEEHTGRSKIFIAAGTGLAPVRSILLTHLPLHPDEEFVLFWGIQKKEDIFYLDELVNLTEKYGNFEFAIFLSQEDLISPQEAHLTKGRVTIGLDRLKTVDKIPFNSLDIYISGAREIVEDLHKYTLSLGATPGHIVVEKFV